MLVAYLLGWSNDLTRKMTEVIYIRCFLVINETDKISVAEVGEGEPNFKRPSDKFVLFNLISRRMKKWTSN